MSKPDCYECEHIGTVPGSAHASCRHPAFNDVNDDPIGGLFATMASVRRLPPMQAQVEGITVKGNPHGIRSGWFNHPYNFDPVWLEECNGFAQKECE